ncbi:hypothetical protein QQS21_007325 [Conoideocrella luteorostrata]|uniref:Amine oxidase n=1 Tax=Conoideocrella luteorostrata TaxID=1105319 RepID=A0AAJ0CNS7_9HYPO|nr:hypothetical protein QQS21_007325 [Conoideocrella luteorostrata]
MTAKEAVVVHPLDPATGEEIEAATALIKKLYHGIPLHFKAAGLQEPPKVNLSAYLQAEHSGMELPYLPRRVFVMWYIHRTPRLFEAVVDVSAGRVERYSEMPRDFHGPVDRAEMNEVAQVVMADSRVKKEIERLQVDDTTIVLDPWDYGVDGEELQERRSQVFMYIRNPENNDPDSCHYSFPLDFMVVVDMAAMKVKKILRLPLGPDQKTTELGTPVPHRRTNPVEAEYTHRLQKNAPRTTVKPYQVVQPEGPSFYVKGSLIEWEKFRFRVGFNWREGITIHDVRFMDRSAFYRLSLSEMFVPYGDPRNPIYRKGAFDLGNVGAGVTANNLALGCDCLGVIQYLGGHVVGNDGAAVEKPNAICIHEIDQGIQWKHTNHRTKNATVVRKRQLVIQQVITVANYEYIFAWVFDQSGEISFETRATGILSTQPIDKDVTVPWGTRVGDGVMAPYHQHIFNVRIDPAVGGDKNTFVYADSVRMPWDQDLNPLGTGYVTKETVINRESSVEDSVADGRIFKIVNRNVRNPVSGTPIGYKVVPIRSQMLSRTLQIDFGALTIIIKMLLAHPGSWHWRRSEFAEQPIWVTKYRDCQLFPAGDYTNQSQGGNGIKSWIDKPEYVVDEDIVIWHTFGFNHIPRCEDFPIMPAEIATMHLKPYNFCEFNPTNNVPPSSQDFNRSMLYEDHGKQPANGKQTNGSKETCCGKNGHADAK